MPCNGVVVTIAKISAGLVRHLRENPENLTRLGTWLREQTSFDILIDLLYREVLIWCSGYFSARLRVTDETIELISDGAARAAIERIETVMAYVQMYAGMLAQTEVVAALRDLGGEPRDLVQYEDGSIEVRINLSDQPARANSLYRETARVRIWLDGSMRLVTEDGAYEAGKRKLELLLGLLGGRVSLTTSGEYESHRHDLTQEQLRIAW